MAIRIRPQKQSTLNTTVPNKQPTLSTEKHVYTAKCWCCHQWQMDCRHVDTDAEPQVLNHGTHAG